jgi:hypothetical protein
MSNTIIQEIPQFIFSGKAEFQVVNKITGKKFVFKIVKKKDVFFVSARLPKFDAPGFSESLDFFGTIFDKNNFVYSRSKARLKNDQSSVVFFQSIFQNLVTNSMPENFEVHHIGKCGRCARALTDLTSVATGFGADCAEKMGIDTVKIRIKQMTFIPEAEKKEVKRVPVRAKISHRPLAVLPENEATKEMIGTLIQNGYQVDIVKANGMIVESVGFIQEEINYYREVA